MNSHIDFIGIGAQKSGTSWIYACLEEHPQVCMPLKEIHYFSKEQNYSRGTGWYLNHFNSCDTKSIVGEFSTTYVHSDLALQRLHDDFSDVKIIVSLRDPLSRAESHFNNDIRAGLIEKNSEFSKELNITPDYWQRGLYSKKIQWLFDKFGKQQVFVAILEDSISDPRGFISDIYRFLGIEADFIPPSVHRKINVSAMPRSVGFSKLLDRGGNLMRRLGLSSLLRMLRKSGLIERIRKVNDSGENDKPLEHVWDKNILLQIEKDRVELELILNKNLGHWRSNKLVN